MLYSLKNETGHARPRHKSTNKSYEIIPTHCPPTHTLLWINHPHLSNPPIIHNSHTMDTKFLVEMRQSKKGGSVMNDEILHLHLGSGAGPWVNILYLLQNTSHIYWFHMPKELTRKNQRTNKWDSTPKKPWDKWWQDQHAERRQKNSIKTHIVHLGLTYGSQHLER